MTRIALAAILFGALTLPAFAQTGATAAPGTTATPMVKTDTKPATTATGKTTAQTKPAAKPAITKTSATKPATATQTKSN